MDCRCEADLWADGVAVHFNDNAWATPTYSRTWASEVFAKDVDTDAENILFADNLGGQGSGCGKEFKRIMKEDANTLVWNLPKNCTDEVQPGKTHPSTCLYPSAFDLQPLPLLLLLLHLLMMNVTAATVDAGYGFDVRREVGHQFTLWLDAGNNCDLWHSDDGLPAYKRRVLMTRWVKAACDKFNNQPGRVRGFFERTGCLLAHDGHTDKLIKLEGLVRPYDYMTEGQGPRSQLRTELFGSEDSSDEETTDPVFSAAAAAAAEEQEDEGQQAVNGVAFGGLDSEEDEEDEQEDVDVEDEEDADLAPAPRHVNGLDSLGDAAITDRQSTPAELTSDFLGDYLDPEGPVITTLSQALGATWERHDAGVPRVGAYVAYCFAAGEDMGGWEVGRLCKQERPLSSRLWAVKFPSEEYKWRVVLDAEKKIDCAGRCEEDDTFCWTIVVRLIETSSSSAAAAGPPPPPPPLAVASAFAAAVAAVAGTAAAAVAAAAAAAFAAAESASAWHTAAAAAVAVVAAASSSSSSSEKKKTAASSAVASSAAASSAAASSAAAASAGSAAAAAAAGSAAASSAASAAVVAATY